MTRTLTLVSAVSTSVLAGQNGSPIAKLTETVGNLLQSMEEEQSLDTQNYKEFFGWCQDTFKERKEGNAQYEAIEAELRAKVKVTEAVNRQLRDEVQQLQAEINEAGTAIKQGSGLRDSEHDDYLREQKGSAGVVEVLNKATQALTSNANRATLLQVAGGIKEIAQKSAMLNAVQRETLEQFTQATLGASSTDAIQNTGEVLSILKDLSSTFEGSIAKAQEQERAALQQYDNLIGLKKNSLLQLQTSMDTKDALLAESEQRIAQLKKSVEDAALVTKTSQNYIAGIKKICADESNGWAARAQDHQDVIASLQALGNNLQGQQGIASFLQTTTENKKAPQKEDFGGLTMMMPTMTTTSGGSNPEPVALLQTPTIPVMTLPNNGAMTLPAVFGTPEEDGHASNPGMAVIPQMPSMQSVMPPPTPVAVSNPQIELQKVSLAETQALQQKQTTYAQVKRMVEDMILQIQNASADEDSHKKWCDAELNKNEEILDEKNTHLKRIKTKVDGETELMSEITQALSVLSNQQAVLKKTLGSFIQLRTVDKNLYLKGAQNHQVAVQILQQAVVILQRYAALVQESQLGGAGNQNFLANQNGNANNGNNSASALTSAVDGFNNLQTKYQQLREAREKSENQLQLNLEMLQRQTESMENTLTSTSNYRNNLKLQAASELDSDQEEVTAVKRQTASTESYVSQLKSACSDILAHYDERRARRQQNLNALSSAKNIINIDNADEVHQQLAALASNADQAAEKLLQKTSGMSALQTSTKNLFSANRAPTMVNSNSAATTTKHSLQTNILSDLQSLQSISSSEQSASQQANGGLDMLAA